MSKDKSLDTIRIQNRRRNSKHNVPRNLAYIVDKIENLRFVRRVGRGRYRETKKFCGIEVHGYCSLEKFYCVNLIGRKYEWKLRVYVPEEWIGYEFLIERCFSNK